MADNPEEHSWIGDEEKIYIMKHVAGVSKVKVWLNVLDFIISFLSVNLGEILENKVCDILPFTAQ